MINIEMIYQLLLPKKNIAKLFIIDRFYVCVLLLLGLLLLDFYNVRMNIPNKMAYEMSKLRS